MGACDSTQRGYSWPGIMSFKKEVTMECCQACRREAPVKYVEFYQNIGMLVMRQLRSGSDWCMVTHAAGRCDNESRRSGLWGACGEVSHGRDHHSSTGQVASPSRPTTTGRSDGGEVHAALGPRQRPAYIFSR